jgi:hypothetical protein
LIEKLQFSTPVLDSSFPVANKLASICYNRN